MTNDETRAAWRGRAFAAAGLAAALAGAGLIAATNADAATTPVLTNTAPAKVLNDGTTAPLSLRVDNSGTGNPSITGTLGVTVSVPSGINCANVTLTPADATDPAFGTLSGGTTGTCTATTVLPYTIGTAAALYQYSFGVAASQFTGTVTTAFTLNSVSNGNVTPVATSNTGSTQLVGPNAAVFASSLPNATVYKAYSAALVTTAPLPTGSYSLYSSQRTTAADGTVTYGALTGPTPITGVTSLNDGLSFNPATGLITRAVGTSTTDPSKRTDDSPSTAYYVVANNGSGGAATATTGTSGGTTAPTPALLPHDVLSPLIDIKTLFSDVADGSQFAKAIYTLASEGAINGYADGTFRPAQSISRQAFAAILGGSSLAGPCTTANPSPFSDVPNSSQFCNAIATLASRGVISGYSDGGFHPTATVTRQATAAFLYRQHSVDVSGRASDATFTPPSPFNDVTASNPFAGDIQWLAANKIASGYSDGGFHPVANVSRQAFAQFLYTFQGVEQNS